jgi:hypothetical protein
LGLHLGSALLRLLAVCRLHVLMLLVLLLLLLAVLKDSCEGL